MVGAPDSARLWAPDSGCPDLRASDSRGRLTLGRAVELLLSAKANEGASSRTIECYRMVTVRLVRAPEPDHRSMVSRSGRAAGVARLAPHYPRTVSVAGYVRTLLVLGNWLGAEGLAEAAALRGVRRPRVPHKVIEPIADDLLRRMLSVCWVRDRAMVLLVLDTSAPRVRGGQHPTRRFPVRRHAQGPPLGIANGWCRSLDCSPDDRPLPRSARPGQARRRPAPRAAWRDQQPEPPAHAPAVQGRGRSDRSAQPALTPPRSLGATSSTAATCSASGGSSATRRLT